MSNHGLEYVWDQPLTREQLIAVVSRQESLKLRKVIHKIELLVLQFANQMDRSCSNYLYYRSYNLPNISFAGGDKVLTVSILIIFGGGGVDPGLPGGFCGRFLGDCDIFVIVLTCFSERSLQTIRTSATNL